MQEVKCVKLESGYYRIDSDYTTDTWYIFRLSKGFWGICNSQKGMTRKTFSTLRDAKSYLGVGRK